MPATCATCGASEPPAALVDLEPLDEGHREMAYHLTLCQRCLARREAISWPLDSRDGRTLMDTLDEHRLSARARYMYMKEGEDHIHLLRLRHDWFDHYVAQPGGPPPARRASRPETKAEV